jgi:hypothetical protein
MIDMRDYAEVPDHGLALSLLGLSMLTLSSALGTRCHVTLPVGYLVIHDPMSGPVPRPRVSLSLGALLGYAASSRSPTGKR